jgi:FtsP/CotA-like multicopper oxidase with cupredoxin domain
MSSRRTFIQTALGLGAGLFAVPKMFGAQHEMHAAPERGMTGRASALVNTPDVPNLPFTMDGNVKVFHLIAEPAKRELIPGKVMDVWGYNGSCPGPTIQITQGDRVRIILENRLPEATTMHWHGLEIPVEMDGMPYISQKPIMPGERFAYEFTLHQEGTYFYHSHGAMQEMLGMIGLFIIHPKEPYAPRIDHDFGIILQGWAILPNNSVPNTAGMEFNWLTFNGKAGPATTPLLVRLGSRVRIRFVNLGMDHHPIHVHGHTFAVTGTEGGRQPKSTWNTGNTVLVGVAQARDVEFVASNPGDWMVHCHLPHHMMNSMMDLMSERMLVTGALDQKQAQEQMQLMMAQGGVMSSHGGHGGSAAPPSPQDPNRVPGFPQDAFMEMAMDDAIKMPETYGLPRNWTAGMQGMMSLLRVLPHDKYDAIMARVRNQKNEEPMQHQHGGR